MFREISVIGLGKLGFPIYEVFKENGFKVIGIDKEKVAYPFEFKKKKFTTSFSRLGDISFVIVPTPSLPNNKFSSEYVENVLKRIKRKHIVVIVSTLMPGETDRLQKLYKHLTLIYNPTFVALGQVEEDFTCPDFILIGGNSNKAIGKLLRIYARICKNTPPIPICVLKPLEAEIAKLALNCYITTKITFANQIGNLCYQVGANANLILHSIGYDSRIGQKYFKAGLGYGGFCFPRDNLALSEYMYDNHTNPRLLEIIHELNCEQIDEIIDRIEKIKPKSIGFESLGYSEKNDYTEDSQLLEIYNRLKKQGYKVKMGKGHININQWGIE